MKTRLATILAAALAVAGCGEGGGGDPVPTAAVDAGISAPVPTGFGVGVANDDARGYSIEVLWADAAGTFHSDFLFALDAAPPGGETYATAVYGALPGVYYFLTITDDSGVSVDSALMGPLADGEFALSHWRVVGGVLVPVYP